MVRKDTSSLVKMLRRDKRYLRLKESFDTLPLFNMPIDQYHKDIDMYHKSRPIRNLNPANPKIVDQLLRASIDDQGYRSRVVAIIMECVRASASLESAVDAYKEYVLVHYSEDLKSLRTKEERMMVIKTAVGSFQKYINKVQVLRDCCDLLVKDIDQGAWSLKLSVQTLELHSQREMTI